jgi:hypothetical protein
MFKSRKVNAKAPQMNAHELALKSSKKLNAKVAKAPRQEKGGWGDMEWTRK